MRSYTLPDGTVIEITHSDSYSGPGVTYGQRVGSAWWYRVNGGEWKITSNEFRHLHKLHEWIFLCENLTDFIEMND